MSEIKKVALVTGASRGIGKAIAMRLARDGFIVIGTATTENGANVISECFKTENFQGEGMVLNVTDDEQVQTIIKAITEKYAAPAVLVNNAGITKDNLFMRMKDDEWHEVIDTNLNALFRVTKACIKGMTKARWGRVINISSVVGSMGNPGQANYAATKAGAEGFARALAAELGSRAITVNSVAPGFIDTDMTRELSEEHKAVLLSKIPLGRLGDAEEVAAAVAFLASDDAAYISGSTLHVNGGMYMV